ADHSLFLVADDCAIEFVIARFSILRDGDGGCTAVIEKFAVNAEFVHGKVMLGEAFIGDRDRVTWLHGDSVGIVRVVCGRYLMVITSALATGIAASLRRSGCIAFTIPCRFFLACSDWYSRVGDSMV